MFEDGTIAQDPNRKITYKGTKSHNGYLYIKRKYKGKRKQIMIHKLVAICYLGDKSKTRQVNHIDGDKTNNHVDNLEWAIPKENMKHDGRPPKRVSNGKG